MNEIKKIRRSIKTALLTNCNLFRRVLAFLVFVFIISKNNLLSK